MQALFTRKVSALPICRSNVLSVHTRCRVAGSNDIVLDTAISAGVTISRYDIAGALAAVSHKSFSCTMCGKCCTMAADAEVKAVCRWLAPIICVTGMKHQCLQK